MTTPQNTVSPNAVIVVGSLHYDIMIDAKDRPRKGETVTGSRWYPKFGGKGGNQAIAAQKKTITRFVGAVGVDGFSNFMLKNIETHGLSQQWISKLTTDNTGMSVAITDAEGDYGAVIVSGANANIDPIHIKDPLLWNNAKVLILQNEIPQEMNLLASIEAKKNKTLVCLNAAPSRSLSPDLIAQTDLLIVNAIEAQDMCGMVVDSLDTAEKAAEDLIQNFPIVVVTAGGEGVAMASQNGERIRLHAIKVELISTHGAGDVFVGTLCAYVASGITLKNALIAANNAAAVHVSKFK